MRSAVQPEVRGEVRPGYEPVRETFAENFERRHELGGACCVYRDGEKVVELWAACATRRPERRGRPTPWSSCIRRLKGSPR